MSKCKSDDGLETMEKPVKKKQILLNTYFGCSSTSNKAKNDSKTKKTTSSSAPRLVKYKTVGENCVEKSLAPFDARIWLHYDKDGEYATNPRCKVYTIYRAH